MSWDSKALALVALIWAVLAVIYVTVIDMMPGARGWGAGAVIFGALTIGAWYAESLGARLALTGRGQKGAWSKGSSLVKGGLDSTERGSESAS
jgi:hypothetical protein